MLKNQSVATIAAPEFLNIEPYNPLISQCEIKVLYVGENRNGSYITEDVAKSMANSLPGTPIVAAFIEDKDDFGDHSAVVSFCCYCTHCEYPRIFCILCPKCLTLDVMEYMLHLVL